MIIVKYCINFDEVIEPHPFWVKEFNKQNPFTSEIIENGVVVYSQHATARDNERGRIYFEKVDYEKFMTYVKEINKIMSNIKKLSISDFNDQLYFISEVQNV